VAVDPAIPPATATRNEYHHPTREDDDNDDDDDEKTASSSFVLVVVVVGLVLSLRTDPPRWDDDGLHGGCCRC
jgi:hypothetical protein